MSCYVDSILLKKNLRRLFARVVDFVYCPSLPYAMSWDFPQASSLRPLSLTVPSLKCQHSAQRSASTNRPSERMVRDNRCHFYIENLTFESSLFLSFIHSLLCLVVCVFSLSLSLSLSLSIHLSLTHSPIRSFTLLHTQAPMYAFINELIHKLIHLVRTPMLAPLYRAGAPSSAAAGGSGVPAPLSIGKRRSHDPNSGEIRPNRVKQVLAAGGMWCPTVPLF